MFFWNSLAFSMIQWLAAIWSLVPLPFLNPAAWFTYCWSLAWRILSIILLTYEMNVIIWQFERSLALHYFDWDGKENWLFPFLWPVLSFPKLLAYRAKHCNSIVFLRYENSSSGISSPPLALFIVMLPKAHLTSHSRMSGSRWVITPSLLSKSLGPFLNSCDFLPFLNLFCLC